MSSAEAVARQAAASAETLARRLAALERRLTAVERGSQMSRTSVEAGTLTVNDEAGTPVLLVGQQTDGTYAVTAVNGGQVVATGVTQDVLDQITADLALADGAVTEAKLAAGAVTTTKIADDAVSSPKIVAGAVQAGHVAAGSIDTDKLVAQAVTADKIAANAVTADKITANAIDGRVITGSTLAGGEVITAASDGSFVHITTDPTEGAVIDMAPAHPAEENVIPASLRTYREPGFTNIATLLRGPAQDNGLGGAERGAEVILGTGSFNGTAKIKADYIDLNAYMATRVNGLEVVENTTGDFPGSGDLYVGRDLEVVGAAALNGTLAVAGGVTVEGRDIGRGRVGRASSTGNSAAVFAETTVLSIAGLTFKAGRAYRVRTGGAFTMTAAGVVRARLRDRTSAFTVEWSDLGHFPATLANNPFRLGATAYLRRTAGTDLTGQTLALTLQASVSGALHTATATSPRWIEVEDCGDAADYAYAVTI